MVTSSLPVDPFALGSADASEEALRLMVAAVSEAIVMLDPGGRIRSWSPAAERITGHPAPAMLGRHRDSLAPPGAWEAGRDASLEEAAAAGRSQGEGWRLRRDGSTYWAAITITALVDAAGELRGFVEVSHDDTERHRIAETLEAAQRELEARNAELNRSNADLEHFAYVASHDLSEPLRVVSGFATLLERKYGERLDDDATRYIGHVVDGCRRMQALIDDLLAYSRVVRPGAAHGPVALEDVVDDIRTDLAATLAAAGATVERGDLPVVTGDEGTIVQVLQNLIGNAVKYRHTERPLRVRVDAERTEDGWAIRVADNGIGVAPEYRDRVFKMFQRLHTRDAYPGTGIGLAVVRRIVENHGGRVWLDDGDDGGCAAVFTLPTEEST